MIISIGKKWVWGDWGIGRGRGSLPGSGLGEWMGTGGKTHIWREEGWSGNK